MTILSQDNVPALQVLNKKGQWVQADPIPGTLVVNIGDCLAMWYVVKPILRVAVPRFDFSARTNNRFKSTVHRVCNLTGQERYAIPFFFGVDYNATISVLRNCQADDSPSRAAAIKVGEVRVGENSLLSCSVSLDPSVTDNCSMSVANCQKATSGMAQALLILSW